MNNKIFEQAQEKIEESNKYMELYYHLIASGKTSREAKRYIKRKYKHII